MKKIGFILMAFALVLGLTQCKKKLDTVNPATTGKVDVTFSTGGSKTGITEAGVVTWTAGDICHVYASTTGYLGTLTLASGEGTGEGTFTGSITAWTDNETLRFYYLGTNTKKADNTFVIDYSAQDGTLATIASKYHVSCYTEENVSASKTSFNGKMLNQMALAVFDVSGFGSGNVKIYAESGFRNMIKISSTGELLYGVAGINPDVDNLSGHIVIGVAGAKKYVALLPSDGEITMQFTSQSKTGSDEARTISANDFIGSSEALAITASAVVSDYFDLAVASDHVFTVADGKTVRFAKGNLVYDQGRFKMHSQQDGRCFTSNGDISNNYKVSGTFDYFGWGTAGWNNGNLLYMPYTFSGATSYPYTSTNGYGYGPNDGGDYIINLTDAYSNSDWGVYQFGMNTGNNWRTLAETEWFYLLYTRWVNGGLGDGYTHTRGQSVNGVIGLVLYPDDYSGPIYSGSDWDAYEAAGCVFLPGVGFRYGESLYGAGGVGNYWMSTSTESEAITAYQMAFSCNPNYLVYYDATDMRYGGLSVRLVTDVE